MDAENFEMLPRRDRAAIRRIVGDPNATMEMLVEEAVRYRRARGWFVWEDCPSTAKPCRRLKRRLAIPEFEIPVMPDL